MEAWARQLLERVGLAQRLDHRPAELSGGERQRVAVARALIQHPLLVLADEPTGNLDRRTAQSVGQLLLDLHREQNTILVVVTHSTELARQFPRQLEMGDGTLLPPEGAARAAMNFTRLLLRNLFYHWRGNGAVLLGVAVGTAVLTGALLVGDSLRGSLGDLTEEQLEGVTNALVAPRFFREELFDGDRNSGDELVILLQGSAVSSPADQNALPRRVGHIQVIGVKWNRWPLSTTRVHSLDSTENEYFSVPLQKNEVALNEPLAHELRVNVGDLVVLHVQRASGVPRETLLGRRDAEHVLAGIPLKVGAIIPNGNPGSRFNLNPSPAPPRNAFVLLPDLQSALGLQDRVNTVLTMSNTVLRSRAKEELPNGSTNT